MLQFVSWVKLLQLIVLVSCCVSQLALECPTRICLLVRRVGASYVSVVDYKAVDYNRGRIMKGTFRSHTFT